MAHGVTYEKQKDGSLKKVEVQDDRTIADIQAARIEEAKWLCGRLIEYKSPTPKQRSASLGLYDATKEAEVKAGVSMPMAACDAVEVEISKIKTKAALDKYNVYEAFKAQGIDWVDEMEAS